MSLFMCNLYCDCVFEYLELCHPISHGEVHSDFKEFHCSTVLQEEIKITGVTVFVNPYTELDEEDEKEEKAKNEKEVEDEEKVRFVYWVS